MNVDYSQMAELRILKASCDLFLKKGFEATKLADIGKQLNINATFVKKHFVSTTDILRTIVDTVFKDVSLILSSFIKMEFAPLFREEKVIIGKDRLRFSNETLAQAFADKMVDHWAAVLDYLIVHRAQLRVIMLAAMTHDQYSDVITRLLHLFIPAEQNPLYADYMDIGKRMSKTKLDTQLFLQTNVEPLIFCAAFRPEAEYNMETSDGTENRTRTIFLIRQHNKAFVRGVDIMLKNP